MKSRKVGYAPGVYDLFHVGHLNILRESRHFCDFLIAGVVSDELTELAKGRPPVVPLSERLAIVQSIRFVDLAVVEDLGSKLEMWEGLRFDLIIKGEDWKDTEKGRNLERSFAPLGVEVAYLPYTKRTSSSMLRRLITRELDDY